MLRLNNLTLKKLAQHFAGEEVQGIDGIDFGNVLREVVNLLEDKKTRRVFLASTIIALATETDERYRKIISEAAIPLLVNLLNTGHNSHDLYIKTNAAKSIYNLAEDVVNQESIALYGAIPHLVSLHQAHEEEEIGRVALGTLKKLYKNGQFRQMINRYGIEKSLLQRLSTSRLETLMGAFPSFTKKRTKIKLPTTKTEEHFRVDLFRLRKFRNEEDTCRGAKQLNSSDENDTPQKLRNDDSSRRRVPERSLSDSRIQKKISISSAKSESISNKTKPNPFYVPGTQTISPRLFTSSPCTKGSARKNSSPKTSYEKNDKSTSSPKIDRNNSPKNSFDKSSIERSSTKSSPKTDRNNSPKNSFDKSLCKEKSSTKSSPKNSFDKGSPKTEGKKLSPKRKSLSRMKVRARSFSDSDKDFHEDSVNTIRVKFIWDKDKRLVWVDKGIFVHDLFRVIEKKYETQITTEQMKFRDPLAKRDLITISNRQDLRTCFKSPPVEIFITQNHTPPLTPTPITTRTSARVVQYRISNPNNPSIEVEGDGDTEEKPRRRRRQTSPKVQESEFKKNLEPFEHRLRNYQIIKSVDLVIDQQIDPLGQGYFGEVRLGSWRGSNVACKKVYEKSFREKSDQELFLREVAILSALRHPNIVQFLGICVDGKDKIIVTEYMEGGSLNDTLRQTGFKLDSGTLLKIATDIALGMNHLHLEDVLHRDLTSRNILLNSSMDAKVADFGLSKNKVEDNSVSFTMGSLAWMPPEVLTYPKNFTKKSDVYSYGMVMWELFVSGKNPWPSALTHVALANKVINEAWRPSLPRTCPSEWAGFIEQCWAQNPGKRPEFKTIIANFQGGKLNPPETKINASGEFYDDYESEGDEDSHLSEGEAGSQTLSMDNTDYDKNIS